jgi:hypothetical protein
MSIIAACNVILPDGGMIIAAEGLILAGGRVIIAACNVIFPGSGMIITAEGLIVAGGGVIITVPDSAHVRRSIARRSHPGDRLREPTQRS